MRYALRQSALLLITLFIPLFASAETPETIDCSNLKTHHKQPTNFLGPAFQVTLTPCPVFHNTAVSFLGEAGPRVYRFGGTLGMLTGQSRIKLSGEQLGQDIEYRFSTGKVRRWVHQYAVGGMYQYDFCNRWIQSLDLEASYSRAFSRSLRPLTCTQTDPSKVTTLYRSIAGGRNAQFGAGVTLAPWKCASLSIAADYDITRYVRQFRCDEKHSGFGATARLNQLLPCDFSFNAALEIRQPFNYYEASVAWGRDFGCTFIDVRLYGSYTQGFDRLPNRSTVGVSLDVAFGSAPMFTNCRERNLYLTPSNCNNACCGPCYVIDPCLLAWVANPAVYMPAVLAIPSEALVTQTLPVCVPPFQTMAVPDPAFVFTIAGQQFDVTPYFGGSDLVFTMVSMIPNGLSISPNGIITWDGTSIPADQAGVVVTATNACGQVSIPMNFFSSGCQPPMIIMDIPDVIFFSMISPTFDLAPYFSGGPLTFTLEDNPYFTITPFGLITWNMTTPVPNPITLNLSVDGCGQGIGTLLTLQVNTACQNVTFGGPDVVAVPGNGSPVSIAGLFIGTSPITFSLNPPDPNFTLSPTGDLAYVGPPLPMPTPFPVGIQAMNCGGAGNIMADLTAEVMP